MVNKKDKQREQYPVSIGPIMKGVLEKQKDKIRAVTMQVCDPSNWEAMEIIGRKIIENNLL